MDFNPLFIPPIIIFLIYIIYSWKIKMVLANNGFDDRNTHNYYWMLPDLNKLISKSDETNSNKFKIIKYVYLVSLILIPISIILMLMINNAL